MFEIQIISLLRFLFSYSAAPERLPDSILKQATIANFDSFQIHVRNYPSVRSYMTYFI